MKFINNDFMLKSKTAKKLYSFVEDLPIIDYHCHLNPKLIAENYKFKNACDLFLGGDHYKWRQLRTNGVSEEYITGDKSDYEKFEKFAETMPLLIGNPLYHWTHLELKRFFGIDKTLCPATCKEIWDKVNELLSREEYRAQGLIKKSKVEVICTTDDPADSLEYHKKLQNFSTKVLPTFRPDKVFNIELETFIPYLQNLKISTYKALIGWLEDRISYFNEVGCKISDHSLEKVFYSNVDGEVAFNKRLKGEPLTSEEIDGFKTSLLKVCAKKYKEYGFAMQLHIGALRNNNKRAYDKLGADVGFDSINDLCIAENLSKLLNSLDFESNLPKTILYTLNPKDNYVLGTMLGNFQGEGIPGKIQFGSGWWFNDQRDGMESQMKALSNLGMISKFVGMLTDSRSFVSYTRHEYFRRILCNLIGKWVEEGEYPKDYETLKKIVQGICYYNAKEYFNF